MGHLDNIQCLSCKLKGVTNFQIPESKTSKKFGKKLIYIFMTILGLVESFKMMNRPDPTRFNRNALWRLISRKVYKIKVWNFDTIFMQVLNLYYWNLQSIFVIVWKLCAFWQRSNIINFQSFIMITFDWNWNSEFWWNHRKDIL